MLTPKQVLRAFGDAIEPVRPSLLYRLWILIVAAVMVVLPLVYVGIIALVVAALVYHAVHHVTIFQMVRGRGVAQLAALVYLGPLVAGLVVVALMIKPLFARPGRGPRHRVLEPGAEPLLYAFVDGVCTTVGAPRPARVEVDCRVNASAHRDGGFLGVFGGKLVLTIGLPLAAGLTLPQFAGVLAHEFGHFAQGAGMRLYGLIMRVNQWFARVVYERDEWDETIASWSSNEHGFILILAGLVRLAVWLTRRVLWVLMQIGHIVSGFLSRQMEFDADRYKARMIGAEAFAQTMWQFQVLSLAENGAFADLQSSWQQRRLPDSFPKLVVANVPQIPAGVMAACRQAMDTTATKLFDTHPSTKDRITRARREAPGSGIFQLDGPATDVFGDFDALARSASFDMYKSALGRDITKDQLYAVSELVETQTAAQEGDVAAGRFFLGALRPTQALPLLPDYPAVPTDLAAARQELVQARDELLAARSAALHAAEGEEAIRNRLYVADVAEILLKVGITFKPADLELSAATPRAADSARKRAESELRQLDEASAPFAAAAARRLTAALALLEADSIAERIPEGHDRRDEARALYPCAAHCGRTLVPEVARLFHARLVLTGIVRLSQSGGKDEARINAMLRAAAGLRDRLEECRWKVGDALVYPFEHANEDVTLARFAFPPLLPDKNDVAGLLDASAEVLDRLTGLYRRALGRLVVTAEEIERALGLSAIAVDPPDPDQDAVPIDPVVN
jgi:Zn-dependent protease with chaperone function